MCKECCQRKLCNQFIAQQSLSPQRRVKSSYPQDILVHLNKCLYRQHKNLVLFHCEVKVAKPEPSLVDLTLQWVCEGRLSLSTL